MRILITGGAGFVGRHLTHALIEKGHAVRVLDSLVQQVHPEGVRPRDLHPAAEFIRGDVRDAPAVRAALEGVDAVFHQASEVGVGQSMHEIPRFVEANALGTAILLQEIVERRGRIRKLVVASSMTLYGEGSGGCPTHGVVDPGIRPVQRLEQRHWDPVCPQCGETLSPAPTAETKLPYPTSVYAITKRDQEELCLTVGRAYDIPTTALRYFNIYGPGQTLTNPYTGVMSIFLNRMLNGEPALIYEDGRQSRDFVHVRDVVQANLLALEAREADYQAFNVSSGELWTVGEVAALLRDGIGQGRIEVTGRFRAGDVRHCHADLTRIRKQLGYRPGVGLRDGLPEVVRWAAGRARPDTGLHTASRKLEQFGLVR